VLLECGCTELGVVAVLGPGYNCVRNGSLYSDKSSERKCSTPSAKVAVSALSLYRSSEYRCPRQRVGFATLGCKGQLCDGTLARGTGIAHEASPYTVEARGTNAGRAAALVLPQQIPEMHRSGINKLPDGYM
jgi:hypothetical protein